MRAREEVKASTSFDEVRPRAAQFDRTLASPHTRALNFTWIGTSIRIPAVAEPNAAAEELEGSIRAALSAFVPAPSRAQVQHASSTAGGRMSRARAAHLAGVWGGTPPLCQHV